MLIDSHCHINFAALAEDMPGLLARAKENDVAAMLCVAVNLEDFPQVIGLAEQHDNIFASVGVHPCYTDCAEPEAAELVELAQNPRIIAIGETGLDYFHNKGDLTWQQQRFSRHIAAAREVSKPLIIHTRQAADDTMDMLEQEGARDCGGVMHCFAEDWETAKRALDIGFYISFSGIVTFKSATTLQDVAKRVPLDRMLVETDSPYLAPVPFRGKTNEPALVQHTAAKVAELRGMDFASVAEQTTANFFQLFKGAERSQLAAA